MKKDTAMIKVVLFFSALMTFVACSDKDYSQNDSLLTPDDAVVTHDDATVINDIDDSLPDTEAPVPDKSFELPDDPGEQQYAATLADTGRGSDLTVSDPAGNGEKIVTDSVTGLVWQQIVPTVYPGCVKMDTTGQYCTWPEAVRYCRELVYAGFDDWQLPTPHELTTIVDYGKVVDASSGDSAAYTESFPGTPFDGFWTSLLNAMTPMDQGEYQAWVISFRYGGIEQGGHGSAIGTKNLGNEVRCVRREGVVPFTGTRFEEKTGGDGKVIVTDNLTKLEWMKEYVENKTQEEATDYCADLVYGDKDDWRLPGVNELQSLIDFQLFNPASNFSGMISFAGDSNFWTARSYATDTQFAWYLGFNSPSLDSVEMSAPPYYHNARCVR